MYAELSKIRLIEEVLKENNDHLLSELETVLSSHPYIKKENPYLPTMFE